MINYEGNTDLRRKKRNERRKTLFQKAAELTTIAGGDIFIKYVDENGKQFVYTNKQEIWNDYVTHGIRPDKTNTEDQRNEEVTKPTPTKKSKFDLSFAQNIPESIPSIPFRRLNQNQEEDDTYITIEIAPEQLQPSTSFDQSKSSRPVTPPLPSTFSDPTTSELPATIIQPYSPSQQSKSSHPATTPLLSASSDSTTSELPATMIQPSSPSQQSKSSHPATTPLLSASSDSTTSEQPATIIQPSSPSKQSISPQPATTPLLSPSSGSTTSEQPATIIQPSSSQRSKSSQPATSTTPIPSTSFQLPEMQHDDRKRSRRLASTKLASLLSKYEKKKQVKNQSNICFICKGKYKRSDDKKNPWVGCENEHQCHSWAHFKCIGWGQFIGTDVTNKKYMCPACL